MKDQPEALRLADYMDDPLNDPNDVADAVSGVLRGLYQFAEDQIGRATAAEAALQMTKATHALKIAAVEAQRDALLEALKEYGWHHEGCPQYPTYTHPDRWPACTCGFDDAIKAVEGEGK